MLWTILFWTGLIGFGFVVALALQLRLFGGLALRGALFARDSSMPRAVAFQAVDGAIRRHVPPDADPALREAIGHLQATYPAALDHMRLARLACRVLPFAMVALLAARQVLNGGL